MPLTSRLLALVLGVTLGLCAWAQPLISGIESLRHARIGVIQGSAHDIYAQKHFPEARLLQFVAVPDMILAVEAGHLDAAIYDEGGLRAMLKEKPHMAQLGDSIFEAQVGAGFHPDSDTLRQQFNAFVTQIKADGTWQDMVDRWIHQGRTEMPAIALQPDAPPLRVGNAILGLPSVAVQNGQKVGFEIEMATRFAAAIGRQPTWNTVDWNALIPALVSKKIDVIISSMYITPERQKRIDFSAPYYTSGNYFFTLASRISGAAATEPDRSAGSFWSRLKDSFYSNLILEDRYVMLLDGLWVTLKLSVFSALLGTLIGAVVCALRMAPEPWLSVPARIYIAVLRGTPVLVLLMLIFYVVFASVPVNPVWIAIIAFGLNFGAYAAEIFRSGVQSIDRGQTEAGVSMGFSSIATFWHIVLPQTIQRILPVYKGEFISMVKMTSIVGYVAVQDLTKASDIIRSRTFDAFFPLVMVAVLYFGLAWVLIQVLEWVERRTDPAWRRQHGA
jgi:polar amino acid transport system substrate-binding protein